MSKKTGKVIIVLGPSGVGKSSFLEKILQTHAGLTDIITYTTRPMRPGESEGCPYHFVTTERFLELRARDFFVEWAHVHNNLYGTPWDQIRDAWSKGQAVIMDVDVQGARTIKKVFPDALTIFLLPPTIDCLRQRLEKRGVPKDIDLRLKNAQVEMSQASEFDHVIINDDFVVAFEQFRNLIEKLLKNQ